MLVDLFPSLMIILRNHPQIKIYSTIMSYSILVSPGHVANALAMHRVHSKERGQEPRPRHWELQHAMDPEGQLQGAQAMKQAVGDMESTAVEAMPEIVPSKRQDLGHGQRKWCLEGDWHTRWLNLTYHDLYDMWCSEDFSDFTFCTRLEHDFGRASSWIRSWWTRKIEREMLMNWENSLNIVISHTHTSIVYSRSMHDIGYILDNQGMDTLRNTSLVQYAKIALGIG